MIDCYTRPEAIAEINRLGQQDEPFIFVIDYEGEKSYVKRLSEVNSEEVRYAFGKWNNGACEAQEKGQVKWEIQPEAAEVYRKKFEKVQRELNAGNTFLINLTCRIPVSTNLSLLDIYTRSSARYRLWMKDRLVCFSPEIFIRISQGKISGYPMKGTIDAKMDHAEEVLMADGKEAAEHATIVDLIRNDLSIVAQRVTVPRYRYVDHLQTHSGEILQTSSEVRGELRPGYRAHLGDLLFSQLPAGSITGAPKKKTVEIIAEAEDYQRGFYTGVMGICERGCMDSAVMIRYVEMEDGKMYFKAGGGITARSEWENEYKEVIQKAYVPIY